MRVTLPGFLRRLVLNDGVPAAAAAHPAEALQSAMLRALAVHTRPRGCVDYAALRDSSEFRAARAAAAALRAVDVHALASHDERLAFWLNVYNALVLHAVVALGVRWRVTEVWSFFGRVSYAVGPHVLSLDDIEHGILRGNRRRVVPPLRPFRASDPRRALAFERPDPRIHFAITCAARSCPPVGVYRAADVHAQLDLATRNFVNQEVAMDDARGHVVCSRIFKWYARDFGDARDLRAFLVRHLDQGPVRVALQADATPPFRFRAYDWSLQHAACS